MKSTKRFFPRLLSIALAFLFVLTAAAPTFAESAPADQENLTVRIRNGEGLPPMSADQFAVYQIFIGTPKKEGPAEDGSKEWNALSWNNYTLADIKWGASIENDGADLLNALQAVTDDWAKNEDGTNVFDGVTTTAELAKVLEAHSENHFLQQFAKIVLEVATPIELTADKIKLEGGNTDDPKDDSLTITLPDPGYYLFAETGAHALDDAVSEHMLAVMGEQDIQLKASIPTVDKTISDSEHTDKSDVEGVSKEVVFDLKGTLPKNFADFDFYYYLFTDNLSKGLTFVPDSLVVTVVLNNVVYTIDKSQYTLVPTSVSGLPEGDTNITITFNDLTHGDNKVPDTAAEEGLTAGLKYTHKANIIEGVVQTPTEETSYIVLTPNAEIHVSYKAIVNTNAVIGVEGNPNAVDLTYSNDPNNTSHGKTTEKKVNVFAFGLDLKKVGSDDPGAGLPGAGFVLKQKGVDAYAIFKDQWVIVAADGKVTQTFYDTKDAAEAANTAGGTVTKIRRLTGWTSAESDPSTTQVTALITAYNNAKDVFDRASDADREPTGTAYQNLENAKKALENYLLMSEEGGVIPDVYGLDEGEYVLTEIVIPEGYNKMADFDIKINATFDAENNLQSVTYTHGEETITYKGTYSGDGDVPEGDTSDNMIAHFTNGLVQDELLNQKAPLLPFTGGVGTVIFYIVGAVLVAGAVIYLVFASRKRRKTEKQA